MIRMRQSVLFATVTGAGALALVACAAITSFEDFVGTGDGGTEAGASSGSSGSSGGSGAEGGADGGGGSSSGDGGDASTCRNNGSSCNRASDCCSGACNQKEDCASSCKPEGTTGCDPTDDEGCCLRSYCSYATSSCKQCLQNGAIAEPLPDAGPDGGSNRFSCCSRRVSGGKCIDD